MRSFTAEFTVSGCLLSFTFKPITDAALRLFSVLLRLKRGSLIVSMVH